MPKGEVTTTLFPIEGSVPKFARSSNGTRKSEIEDTLDLVASENSVGATVCIRQYAKKESASGTLYNLRHRPHDHTWTFNIGPLDEYGDAYKGMTGLFATLVSNSPSVPEVPVSA